MKAVMFGHTKVVDLFLEYGVIQASQNVVSILL